MTNSEDICEVVRILNDAGQKTRMRIVYEELLKIGISDSGALEKASLLRVLLLLLPTAAFMLPLLLNSQLWKVCKDSVFGEAWQRKLLSKLPSRPKDSGRSHKAQHISCLHTVDMRLSGSVTCWITC